MQEKHDLTGIGGPAAGFPKNEASSAQFPPELRDVFGFQSKLARAVARLTFLGFLAGLGFLPGWHRMLGFSGFFGFFGLAVVIEAFARLRRGRKTVDGQRHKP